MHPAATRDSLAARLRVVQLEWGILEVILCFALSRILWAFLGVQFDATGLDRYWQFLPSDLLRTDLLRSLWHLHAQPPLFNAFLGLGLQLFDDPTAFFHLVFAASSLALHLAFFRLLTVLEVPRRWAVLALVIFSLNPSLATHENWLFYAQAEVVLLAAAAASLGQFHRTDRAPFLWLWALLVGTLLLTRAAFHPLWLLLVLALWALSRWRKGRTLDRRVLRVAAVPLLLVLLWMGKNQLLFGDFSTSSWLGMNLARVSVTALPDPLLERHLARHELTPFAQVGPFRPLGDYAVLLPPRPPTGIRALDGQNFNNSRYLEVAHALRHDSLFFIRTYPGDYLDRVHDGVAIFLETTNHNAQLHDNRERLAALESAYNAAVRPGGSPVIVLLALLAALAVGLQALATRKVALPLERNDLLAAFLTATVLWVSCTGTFLEFGENNRFRFGIDPLVLVLLVYALTVLRRTRLKRT